VATIKPGRRSAERWTIKSRVSMWIAALTAHEAVERWRPELIKRRSSKGRWGPHVEQGRWPPRVKRWMAKRPIVKPARTPCPCSSVMPAGDRRAVGRGTRPQILGAGMFPSQVPHSWVPCARSAPLEYVGVHDCASGCRRRRAARPPAARRLAQPRFGRGWRGPPLSSLRTAASGWTTRTRSASAGRPHGRRTRSAARSP